MLTKVDPEQQEHRTYSPEVGNGRKKLKLSVNEDVVDEQSLPESDEGASTSRYFFYHFSQFKQKIN